jgi:hypothetical protein
MSEKEPTRSAKSQRGIHISLILASHLAEPKVYETASFDPGENAEAERAPASSAGGGGHPGSQRARGGGR